MLKEKIAKLFHPIVINKGICYIVDSKCYTSYISTQHLTILQQKLVFQGFFPNTELYSKYSAQRKKITKLYHPIVRVCDTLNATQSIYQFYINHSPLKIALFQLHSKHRALIHANIMLRKTNAKLFYHQILLSKSHQ